jgi:hypothetical protein
MYRKLTIVVMIGMLIAIFLGVTKIEGAFQVSATPATINLSTSTLPATVALVTATPTRTPTPIGMVILEAITEANVRAEPDPESERLGTIHAGEIYTVLGRYFRWIQFQYDTSPNGRGWVFEELVTITGDLSAVDDLAAAPQPTVDPIILGATETQAAITQTPGGLLTATANARIIPAPVAVEGSNVLEGTEEVGIISALPTFTYPPDVLTPAVTSETFSTPTPSPDLLPISVSDGVPPIVPILLLGGLGLLGLAVSSIRR